MLRPRSWRSPNESDFGSYFHVKLTFSPLVLPKYISLEDVTFSYECWHGLVVKYWTGLRFVSKVYHCATFHFTPSCSFSNKTSFSLFAKIKPHIFFFLKSIGPSFAEKLMSNRFGSISAHFDGFTIFKSKRVLIWKEFGLGINYFGVRKITH